MSNFDDWITAKQASEIIGVTDHQVRYLIRQGKLEAKKFGWAWMINRQSAEDYARTDRKPGPKSGT